jgi:hypothetical protein
MIDREGERRGGGERRKGERDVNQRGEWSEDEEDEDEKEKEDNDNDIVIVVVIDRGNCCK